MVTAPTRKARTLRSNMTEPEIWLWARLRRMRPLGYHFRRRRPFKGYFLDFVCIDRLLFIELDGGQHSDPIQAEHDGVRDAVLTRAGFKVLRFWNSEIRTNIGDVMDRIMEALRSRSSVRGKVSLDE